MSSDSHKDPMATRLNRIAARLDEVLELLQAQQAVREWYTTAELAQALGKSEFTVREWCRLGRVRAEKRQSGRGAHAAWVVGHEELLRYQKEGLLPDVRRA